MRHIAILVLFAASLFSQTGLPSGFAYQTVTTLTVPVTAMSFAPDGRIFLCERHTGNVRIVVGGVLQTGVWWTAPVPTVTQGEGGLLGIAIDPNFASNGNVYLHYTTPVTGGYENHIVVVQDVSGAGTNPTTLYTRQANPNRIHNGGPLRIGPDGLLWCQTGDADLFPFPSQLPNDPLGKILRLSLDGLTIPTGNLTATSPAWAMGFRNGFGFCFDFARGELLQTENGQNVGDEINRIPAGADCGWRTGEGFLGAPYTDPLVIYSPQPALTGIAMVDTESIRWSQFHGDALFGSWASTFGIRRLTFNALGAITSNTQFATYGSPRIYAIENGPDGDVYVLSGVSPIGGTEIGRFVDTTTAVPGLHMGPVARKSVGGSVTCGIADAAGTLTVAWLSFTLWTTPAATSCGNVWVPADTVLSAAVCGADGRAYSTLQLANVPSSIGVPLYAQGCSFYAGGACAVTPVATHVLR